VPQDLAEVLWNAPHELIDRGEPLRAVGMRQTVQITWAKRRYVFKHYVEPSWRHALKRTVLPARAWQTWQASHRLADAGVATPRAAACVENRWGMFGRDSFLMYEYVEGRTLRSYFAGEVAAEHGLLDQYWAQLRDLWRQLAELRVTLGDANLSNFIVAPTGQLWVIDLDKTRFHRWSFRAKRHERLRWNQALRSAAKCSQAAALAREQLSIQLKERPTTSVSSSS
jgi:hypothetical protein